MSSCKQVQCLPAFLKVRKPWELADLNLLRSCRGYFSVDANTPRSHLGHLPDTYINMRNWSKGLVFINTFNLGWYWPRVGPQGAQYIPGPLLRTGQNEIIIVEVEDNSRPAASNSIPSGDSARIWKFRSLHRKHVPEFDPLSQSDFICWPYIIPAISSGQMQHAQCSVSHCKFPIPQKSILVNAWTQIAILFAQFTLFALGNPKGSKSDHVYCTLKG